MTFFMIPTETHATEKEESLAKAGVHSDILKGDWVDRILPAGWRPYARLARFDRPIGTWLLLLPCLWALVLGGDEMPASHILFLAALFAVGAVVMRGAGCVINDMWDVDIDAQVERTRTRPLASGAVTMRQASVFLLFLLLIGLGVVVQFPLPVVAYGFAACALIVVYPLMKRVTWWPQAFLGFTFNWGVIMGAAAVNNGRWELPDWTWPLYAAGILWTLGYDTIYAHQDKKDDVQAGVKSLALRLGAKSRLWISGFYAGVIGLLALSGLTAGTGWGFYPVLLLIAGGHLVWQVATWEMDDPANCLRRFRTNRDFGLLVLLAVVCGRVIG